MLPGAVGGGIAVRELSKVTKKGWNKFMSLFKKGMGKASIDVNKVILSATQAKKGGETVLGVRSETNRH